MLNNTLPKPYLPLHKHIPILVSLMLILVLNPIIKIEYPIQKSIEDFLNNVVIYESPLEKSHLYPHPSSPPPMEPQNYVYQLSDSIAFDDSVNVKIERANGEGIGQ